MATNREIQETVRRYKRETGDTAIDPTEVARWMIRRGYSLPEPPPLEQRVAESITRALREETRQDATTGRPYRANHAYPTPTNQGMFWTWIDIDEAPREPMRKSLQHRREQMVGDGLQLSLDADHWNATHHHEQPIAVVLDFTDDVEWRKNAPDDRQRAG